MAKKAPADTATEEAKKPARARKPKADATPAEKPARKPKGEAAAKEPKEPADRSAAISNSWTNPDTAAARSLKSKVKVAGVEYRSVLAAFQELGLPVNKHIAFRKQLKAEGKLTFQDDTGKKHNFVLVPPAAE